LDWRLKATVQKVLGVLPWGYAAHYHLQRRFGGLRNPVGEFKTKMSDWQIMAGHLRNAGLALPGSRLFEVGSGWYPTFPFACYLAGARRMVTVDLNRHLQPELVRMCAAGLERMTALIAAASGEPEAEIGRRQRHLADSLRGSVDLGRATEGVVEYLAPADATRSGLDAGSIDCVFSNSVLEHVPPDVIRAMYVEALRILAPGGMMFHSVNCGDHYAYVDRSISQLNYLRYSDRAWQRWNNAFLYQNRLRAHRFVDEARAVGFAIELDTSRPHPQRLRELAAVDVHAQFAGMPAEVLCITSVDFIGRKPVASAAAPTGTPRPGGAG
jgi:SAM-dependent methyltransferase